MGDAHSAARVPLPLEALALDLCLLWAPAVCSSLRPGPVACVLGLLVFFPWLTSAFRSFSEEERTRFRELLASPSYRASPLLAIGRQLARQMQLEGGEQL